MWANGGYVTKHALRRLLDDAARPTASATTTPQAEIDALPRRELADAADAAGPATIEAYTVMHDRDGEPETAFAACLLADGRRAWGTSAGTDDALARCARASGSAAPCASTPRARSSSDLVSLDIRSAAQRWVGDTTQDGAQ